MAKKRYFWWTPMDKAVNMLIRLYFDMPTQGPMSLNSTKKRHLKLKLIDLFGSLSQMMSAAAHRSNYPEEDIFTGKARFFRPDARGLGATEVVGLYFCYFGVFDDL